MGVQLSAPQNNREVPFGGRVESVMPVYKQNVTASDEKVAFASTELSSHHSPVHCSNTEAHVTAVKGFREKRK